VKLIEAVEITDYLSPRHWPTWIGIGLLRAAVLLPLPVLVVLGSALGQLLYYLAPQRRRISEINLRIAFPDYGAAELRKLNRASFRNLGIGIFEIGLSWWESERVIAMCEIDGLEHLHNAQRQGRGVIILTAHFTCLEIGGPMLNRHVPLQIMYKRPHNELLDEFMKHGRANYSTSRASHHRPLALLKGLKKGHAMWYAPDQDFGRKDTVFVPLFGVDATALTAPARIARISGAPVVPYYIKRKPRGRGYRLTILPPLQDFPLDDAVADARVINSVIEKLIMENPTQYLWLHRRYKNRPDGRLGMYPPYASIS
jgi:KDO2-lipid IV(A) lauroyltransferase